MKRILFISGLAIGLFSCGNNGSDTERSASGKDTTENVTTNSGAAGTGGVGAGFGTGGSAGTDTNTNPGSDTSHSGNH